MSQREDLYRHLAYIALREFPDVVVGTEIVEGKLRVFIVDKSFIDVWFSEKEKVYTHTIGRKEWLTVQFIGITTCLTERLETLTRFPSTFMTELKRMYGRAVSVTTRSKQSGNS